MGMNTEQHRAEAERVSTPSVAAKTPPSLRDWAIDNLTMLAEFYDVPIEELLREPNPQAES